MKEVKYRAWIKEYKGMKNVDSISFKSGLKAYICEETYYAPEEIELLQYTGLKDTVGKDICEGDILSAVKYGTDIPAGSNRWEVYCNKERLTFYVSNQEDIEKPLWEFNLGSVQHIIVGNIYETPELAK
ncbi:YopX family protein [Priestia megaterium]